MTRRANVNEEQDSSASKVKFKFTLTEEALKKYEPLLKILRQSAPIDNEKARHDIDEAVCIVSGYRHLQQVLYGRSDRPLTMSGASKVLKPILNGLVKLSDRLDGIGDERWHHFKLVASTEYQEIESVQQELRAENRLEPPGSDRVEEGSKFELHIVKRDLIDLQKIREIATRVEPRLRRVIETSKGDASKGRPRGSFAYLVKGLKEAYEAHTPEGEKATVITESGDSGRIHKRGAFVDFVEAAIVEFGLGFPTERLADRVDRVLGDIRDGKLQWKIRA